MMHVGLHYFGRRRTKCGYEKLTGEDQKSGRARRRWVKYGRLRGLRMCRSRKVCVKQFCSALTPTRVVRMYNEAVKRANLESICPFIILLNRWGFPVFSHPSLVR